MDPRGLQISGASVANCNRVGGYCLAAMEELDYRSRSLPVQIRHDQLARPGVEAGAHSGGVFMSPDLLADPARMVWVLSEEIAHRYLNEVWGVAHGGDFIDRFAQEGFATWFQHQRMFGISVEYSPEGVVAHPIAGHGPSPELGAALGSHAGAALAGSYKSAARLEEWYASPIGVPAFKERVRVTIVGFGTGRPSSPRSLARAVALAHAAARERGC
jgi:hypothetical protein